MTTTSAAGGTTMRCERCGAAFGCNPGGACWCKEIPPVAPVPAMGSSASCLCPACLRALDAAEGEAGA